MNYSKMSRIIIILATITLASYGKASLCRSTYDVDATTQHQYNNSINCANASQKCLDAVEQFSTVAGLTTNELATIINKEEFEYNVSLMTLDIIC